MEKSTFLAAGEFATDDLSKIDVSAAAEEPKKEKKTFWEGLNNVLNAINAGADTAANVLDTAKGANDVPVQQPQVIIKKQPVPWGTIGLVAGSGVGLYLLLKSL